jgi:hypothetical protein
MPQGWIKLHRRIVGKAFYKKPYYLALWVHLLLSANHAESEFMWNGSLLKVQKGQFVTGRKQLSEDTGIPETTIERILSFFEKDRQIGQQKTSKYRLITIYKWDQYQMLDNKRTTSGQQADTNKNDKNVISNISADAEDSMSFRNSRKYNENKHWEDDGLQIDPDYTPKGKKEKKVSDDVQEVFDLFKNPASALWRLREIERVAAQALFDTYGIETLKKRLQRIAIEREKKDPYFPDANTPSQLLDKMPNIERYLGI